MTNRLLAIALAISGLAAGAAGGETATAILTEKSYWRWQVTMSPPTVEQDGKTVALGNVYHSGHRWGDSLKTPPPPAGWRETDFDDSRWSRSRPEWFRRAAFIQTSTEQLSMRGRFKVEDPARADLSLTLKYTGGAVVYLNGKEIHRAHMPQGTVTVKTFANAYGKEFYVDAGGKLLSMRGTSDALKLTEKRARSTGPVRIPRETLRKGINVLAVEIHRSSYDPVALGWYSRKNIGAKPWWPHADLAEIRLRGSGAQPNVSRPAGFQVWVQDRNDRVALSDYGDPNEPLGTVKLAGARNGSFCGQIVLGSSGPIRGAKVIPGDLTAATGGGNIPASEITVLYAQMNCHNRAYGAWGHGLQENAPTEVAFKNRDGAVLPVLIRVRIPSEAKPGDYRGKLTVSADGEKTVKVPVELHVADWRIPDPRGYRTYMGIYQSPTSLALQYKVKPWSEEHWKLVGKSFAMLSRAGNKMVNVPVADETQFGNPEGMIYWVKKPDGGWKHDFSVFDRFMKMVVKQCGPLDYVCLQVWHAGGWSARPANTKLTVTVLEEETGKKRQMQVPLWGTTEAVAFWKPFFAAVQARLAKLDMPKAMTVGILSDSTAPKEVFKTMSEAWPGGKAMWHRGCHGAINNPEPYSVSKGNYVQLHEHCYGMHMSRPDAKELPQIHTFGGAPAAAYFRRTNHEQNTPLSGFRSMAERALFTGKRGIGRICLDFWPVLGKKDSYEGRQMVFNRYPHSSCAQRRPTLLSLAWASPAGPQTSMRFEALCEGIQDCEALIAVSEAAANEAAIGKELAEECRALLRERLWFIWARGGTGRSMPRAASWWKNPCVHVNHHGWQELSRRTYDLAAQVSKKK